MAEWIGNEIKFIFKKILLLIFNRESDWIKKKLIEKFKN